MKALLAFFSLLSISIVVYSSPVLKAASAKVDITPAIGDSVYCLKPALSAVESIHDKIYARILILDQQPLEVIFVTLDLLYFGDEEVQLMDSVIRKQTGVKELIITNTHAHSGFFVPEHLAATSAKVSAAIIKARQQLVPVSISYATILVDEVYNRRLVKDGKVEMLWQNPNHIHSPAADSSLNVLAFRNEQGTYVSILIDYSAHPVITMNFDKVEVSADYPGALTTNVDEQLGCISLFVLGAAGDLNPYDAGIGPENGSFDKANRLGKLLAENAVNACKSSQQYTQARLIFKKHPVQINFNGKPKTVYIYLVAINEEVAIIGLPGELFSELGVKIKTDSPFKYTMVMGYTGSTTIGYIPTSRAAEEGGYGAENVPVAKGTGELLVNESLKVLKIVKQQY